MRKFLCLLMAFCLLLPQTTVVHAEEETIVTNTANVIEVDTEQELVDAISSAKDSETIQLTGDINYTANGALTIEKAITLDLNGKTLTTNWTYGGIIAKNNCSIINGTIIHKGAVAVIKAWQVDRLEDLTITATKTDAKSPIGGIVVQQGSTNRINTIKNVSLSGEGLDNGIETYNCGDAYQPVIGTMENVTIDALDTGLLISAPVGTAENCTISGEKIGINLYRKGKYSATLTLVNSKVNGNTAIYVHDENFDNETYINTGKLELIIDNSSTLTSANGNSVLDVECGIDENVDITINTDVACTVESSNGAIKYFGGDDAFTKAVELANVDGGTVTLVQDITLSKKIQINKDVTITGEHTITRDANYTGTLFNVASGASLTLDGGLTIDGANNYTFDQEAYEADLEGLVDVASADATKYFTVDESAPIATAYIITTAGTVNLNEVTIKNHYSTGSGIVSASTGANVTLTGATITHCANTNGSGLVVNASTGKWEVRDDPKDSLIQVTMNEGTVIDGNHVGGNHGVFKIYMDTTFTMNGGEIKNTTGWNSNGVAVGVYWSHFIMNGGAICTNSSVYGPNNGRNAPVYLHSASHFVMNGGEICHNIVKIRGALDAPYTEEADNGTAEINNGTIVHNNSVVNGEIDDIYGFVKLIIRGGTYTEDVTQWCIEGFAPKDNGDGTYTVHEHDIIAVDKVDATCEEAGAKAHYSCEVCDEIFTKEDDTYVETTLDALKIYATGHTMKMFEKVEPTCTTEGHEKYGECINEGCDHEIKKVVIPALGHKEVVTGTKEATCTTEGYTGDTVCEVCEEVLEKGEAIEKTAHTYKDGNCTVCDAEDPDYVSNKTGDTNLIVPFAGAMLVSAAVLVLLKKKEELMK